MFVIRDHWFLLLAAVLLAGFINVRLFRYRFHRFRYVMRRMRRWRRKLLFSADILDFDTESQLVDEYYEPTTTVSLLCFWPMTCWANIIGFVRERRTIEAMRRYLRQAKAAHALRAQGKRLGGN